MVYYGLEKGASKEAMCHHTVVLVKSTDEWMGRGVGGWNIGGWMYGCTLKNLGKGHTIKY